MSTTPSPAPEPLTREEVNQWSVDNTRKIEQLTERLADMRHPRSPLRAMAEERMEAAQREARLLATIAQREREIEALNETIQCVHEIVTDCPTVEEWESIRKPQVKTICEIRVPKLEQASRAERALEAAKAQGRVFFCYSVRKKWGFFFEKHTGDIVSIDVSTAEQADSILIISQVLEAGFEFSELGDWEGKNG